MNEQYKVGKYFIDFVFLVQELGIEIHENGHTDRSKIEEQKGSETIRKRLDLK